MNKELTAETHDLVGEPMITAKQAATALGLPAYWFADRAMRARYRIPHYLLVGLVRFRGSELAAWASSRRVRQSRTMDAAGEGSA